MRKITIRFVYFLVILTLFFVLAMLYLWHEGEYQRSFANIDNSEFYRSPEGKIYVQISGSGKYELKGQLSRLKFIPSLLLLKRGG